MLYFSKALLLLLLFCWSLTAKTLAQEMQFSIETAQQGPLEHSWVLKGKIPHFDDVVLDCTSFIHEFRFRSHPHPETNIGWYLDVQECHDIENQVLMLVFAGAQACIELTSSPYRVVIDKCSSDY